MAGIYIHVPFCKSRCIYCGFFSTVSLQKRDEYVERLCCELKERKEYLRGEDVETIYFGGGTPSMLTVRQIERILNVTHNIYNVRARAEVTLEGNPDDLTLDFLRDIYALGINRISMGVQTFDDKRLQFLQRRHTAEQAIKAVENAREAGFRNISIDLMFGFPGQSLDEWKCDVSKAIALDVEHISAYSLMYEEGTLLMSKLDKGEIEEIDDEVSLQMYQYLIKALNSAGYDHYEISNFGKSGCHSLHNSSYWHGIPYLGVGAGAHSYDGASRSYNVESLLKYLEGAELIQEDLTMDEKYNEYVFTGLRTSEGVSLDELCGRFGKKYHDFLMLNAQQHIKANRLTCESDGSKTIIRLSPTGIFVSNDIISDLMRVD